MVYKIISTCCGLLLYSHNLVAAQAQLPPDFVAFYKIENSFLTLGEAERRFKKQNDNTFTYTSLSKTSGVVAFFAKERLEETTQFVIENAQVQPLSYQYQRVGRKHQTVKQTFNWQQQTVTSLIDDKAPILYEIPQKTLDLNVYQFSLMYDLANGLRNMEYHLAEHKKLRSYPIRFIRNETIDSLFGPVETLVIERTYKKLRTTLWAAPRLFYLPVRIKHEEKGDKYTATLQRLTGMTLSDSKPAIENPH